MVKRKELEKSAITASSSSSSKRRNHTDLPFLPKEIMREILIRLPGSFLGSTIRYVCDAWSKIVHDPDFIESHPRRLLSSTSGLLIPELISSSTGIDLEEHDKPCSTLYFQIEQGKIGVTDLNLQLSDVIARCEGALLVYRYHITKTPNRQFVWQLRVVNLMTMEVHRVSPPQKQARLAWNHRYEVNKFKHLGQMSRIARIPGTGEIKILCLCNSGLGDQSYCWMVTTLGDDNSWRKIDYQLTHGEYMSSIMWADSISVGGVIYTSLMNGSSSCVYAIDLCNEYVEKIQLFTKPPACVHSVLTAWENSLCFFLYLANGIKAVVLDLDMRKWIENDYFGSELGRKIRQDMTVPISWSDEGNTLIAIKHKYNKFNCYVLAAYNVKTGRRKTIDKVFFSIRSIFPLTHFASQMLIQ